MAGKKAPDQVYVVIGTVNYNQPTIQGVYTSLQNANEAAFGNFGAGGLVFPCALNYTQRYGTQAYLHATSLLTSRKRV